MVFYEGFKWAVPTAFSDAITTCRFEEGDALYDAQEAYTEEWGKAERYINHIIKVREPSKGAASPVFDNNWNSEVYLELYDDSSASKPRYIRTTQGRLYTTLWLGDLSCLDIKTPSPKQPLQLRDAVKPKDLFLEKEERSDLRDVVDGKPVFMMVIDKTNPTSRAKYITVEGMLKAKYKATEIPLRGVVINHQRIAEYAPTIEYVAFVMECGTYQNIHDTLKSKLYKSSGDGQKDMFRLDAHGLLLAD